jgi:hypothetical protein
MFRSTGNVAINVDKNFRSVFKVDKESGELKFEKVPYIHKCYECSVLKAKLNKVCDKINLVLFFPKC